MTTDPATTVAYFALAFLIACAAGACWEHYADWNRSVEWARERRKIKLTLDRIDRYYNMPSLPDTFPAEWEKAA